VNQKPEPTGLTLHLTPEAVWAADSHASHYVPERFAAEGFVHCTDGEELVLDVGNRYYRSDERSYVVLEVVIARAGANAIYEDDAGQYPHIYGPIDRGAVVRVRRVHRAIDGSFVAIGDPVEDVNPR
jgi:uncharacterized protein (DUF952 family)